MKGLRPGNITAYNALNRRSKDDLTYEGIETLQIYLCLSLDLRSKDDLTYEGIETKFLGFPMSPINEFER